MASIITHSTTNWDIGNHRKPQNAIYPSSGFRGKQNLNVSAKPNFHLSKEKALSKQSQPLFTLYTEAADIFYRSALSKSLDVMLQAKNRPRITRVVSLGLGSLGKSKDQNRRIKQLVILVAIASHLGLSNKVSLYAQDPTFTKIDEQFLRSLGIQILKTSSPSDLGDAARMIDKETLVYSPFLTINAYRQLFDQVTTGSEQYGVEAPMLIGDDFNALRMKWGKHTTEHKDVEELIRATKAGNYQRRVVKGEGFWEDADSTFPMALYRIQLPVGERGPPNPGQRTRAKL